MDEPLDARGDHVRDLPIPRLLDVILALHAAGALDAATEAQAALRSCLQESGLELALVHGPLGGIWTLTEEIGGLPPRLPPDPPNGVRDRDADRRSEQRVRRRLPAHRERSRARAPVGDQVWSTRRPTSRGFSAPRSRSRRPVRWSSAGFQVSRLSFLLIPLALAADPDVRLDATTLVFTPDRSGRSAHLRPHTLGDGSVPGSAFKTQLDVGPRHDSERRPVRPGRVTPRSAGVRRRRGAGERAARARL